VLIRTAWADRRDLAGHIKAALYTLVLCDDQVIRNQAARCFALVLGIELGDWAGAVSDVADKLDQASESPVQAIGLLSIFKEILGLKNFKELLTDAFSDKFIRLWATSLQILGLPGINPLVRFAAAECVRDGVDMLPNLIQNMEQAGALLAALEVPLQETESKLYVCCHRIMFNLVTRYYRASTEFIGRIWDYTQAGIMQPEPVESRNTSIYFWKELADWEREQFKGDAPENQHICELAAESLLPILFEIMCDINPNAIEVEDLNDRSPSMFATVAMASFYQLNPQYIFEHFISPAFREAIAQTDWTRRHAALLLLYAMSDAEGVEDACPFIAAETGQVIEHCQYVEIPHIQETALFVLAQILHNYKMIYWKLDLCQAPAAAVDRILALIPQDLDVHPQILLRYCLILFNVASIWPEEQLFRSPLPAKFETLVAVARRLMERQLQGPEDIELYQSASESLNQIVVATNADENREHLLSLLQMTITELHEVRTAVQEDHVRYAMQAALCSNVTSIAIKLAKRLPPDEFEQCVDILFTLLRIRNTLLYEEALMAVAALYLQHHERFSPDHHHHMLGMIRDGLDSMSPGVINSSAILLGDLFHFSGAQLVEDFFDFFNRVGTLLMRNPEMRDIHPFIIKAIAEMFEGVALVEEMASKLEDQRDQLMMLLTNVRSVPIDNTSESDIQYANYLFEYLAQAYRAFAKVYYPDARVQDSLLPDERIALVEMTEFAKAVAGVRKLSDFVLMQFCKMAQQYAEKCSRKNNVILNRSSVHKVLDMCQQQNRPQRLKKLGKDTAGMLKSR
jgi:hypothetical protein